MRFEPFQMERWQSLHEHNVELNLSDSGAHPLSVRELLSDGDPSALEDVLDQRLIYTQTNGTPELRQRIAALYPDATDGHIQVTNGGAEANLVTMLTLVNPGDEVIVMTPNYMQVWGLADALGAKVHVWPLEPDFDGSTWDVQLAELEELVNPRTKLVAICNPNNPTGHCIGAGVLDQIARITSEHGTWVLSDEIYQGAELDGGPTASMWGRHERVVVTNSLSKAYGLPGLRLGWAVAPPKTCAEMWMRHDYTTIGQGALSEHLGARALEPERRERLLARARGLLAKNYALVAEWLGQHSESLRHIPPSAGAFLYLSYDHPIPSLEFAERLRDEKSVLVVPGAHFGMDGWLRIGFGEQTERVERGLARVHEFLSELS